MLNKNPRINVTFDKNMAVLLAEIAHRENKSVSRLVKELTLDSLEQREDFCLSKIASSLDNNTGKHISHNKAWG